jgi:hypothetical protein
MMNDVSLNNLKVLILDQANTPAKWWGTVEEVVGHYARGDILWASDPVAVLRGGHNKDGNQSLFGVPSIITVRGLIKAYKETSPIPLEKSHLVKRDRHLCAYCGGKFKAEDLRMEHVIPDSRGGPKSWTNIVSSCQFCNDKKRDRTPEEAGMPLLFVPYKPDRYEGLILMNKHILADQMDFLTERLPERSRLKP